MPSAETSRGLTKLKEIFESGTNLLVRDAEPVNQDHSYHFTVAAKGKEFSFSLSRENVDDLPGTKELLSAAKAFAASLSWRFENVDPNYYVTRNGRLLKIIPEWPPTQWYTAGGPISAVGLWAHVDDLQTGEVALCAVTISYQQSMPQFGMSPFDRPQFVVNTIRAKVDSRELTFYPNRQELPNTGPTFRLETSLSGAVEKNAQAYVEQKVWLLGFNAGSGDGTTLAWINDPWDTAYLGLRDSDLQRAAAISAAQERLVLGISNTFARVGRVLLAANGPQPEVAAKTKASFRTALSEYFEVKPIGEGGAGRVIRVKDASDREFALKHLKPEALSRAKNARFRNELSFCMKNRHPNIVTIVDFGLASIGGEEIPFYVMPVFSGTLRSAISKRDDDAQNYRLFLQILEGLEHAHGQGVWHRDLKPENILLDSARERAVISDFGIAHFEVDLLQTTVQTRPQDRLANFRYAAPEQRSSRLVDQRADIYALGLILYELFTGELLQGTQHQRIGTSKPKYAYLDGVVEAMTCQSPDDRLASIQEVKKALNIETVPQRTEGTVLSATALEPFHVERPAPLAYAWYELKGSEKKISMYVRPYPADGWYTYEDSLGELRLERREEVVRSFRSTDGRLTADGYTRMSFSNLSGTQDFALD